MGSGKIEYCMHKKSGFTIVELMVAMAIIGLVAAFGIPRLLPPKPRQVREAFISQLNSLVGFAWQNAVTKSKVHKLEFDFDRKKVSIFQMGPTDKYGKATWEPIKRAYTATVIRIPGQLEQKNFYIEGEDKVAKLGILKNVWFAISDGGISQEVVINFLDNKDKRDRRKRPVGLVLNPFSAQFEVYNELAKP